MKPALLGIVTALTVLVALSASAYADLPAACASYWGDSVCDDRKEDCGDAYVKDVSYDACDECQQLKDGKPGYVKCAAGEKLPNLIVESFEFQTDEYQSAEGKGSMVITAKIKNTGPGDAEGQTYLKEETSAGYGYSEGFKASVAVFSLSEQKILKSGATKEVNLGGKYIFPKGEDVQINVTLSVDKGLIDGSESNLIKEENEDDNALKKAISFRLDSKCEIKFLDSACKYDSKSGLYRATATINWKGGDHAHVVFDDVMGPRIYESPYPEQRTVGPSPKTVRVVAEVHDKNDADVCSKQGEPIFCIDGDVKYGKINWQCYDGASGSEGDASSCKTMEQWAEIARGICGNKCNTDKSKCGVSSLSASERCEDKDKAVCGDGVCSAGSYVLDEGASRAIQGKKVTLKAVVDEEKIILNVDGKAEVFYLNIPTEFNGLGVTVAEINYYPNEDKRNAAKIVAGENRYTCYEDCVQKPAVSVLSVKTDRKFYSLGDTVAITASLKSKDGKFGNVTANVTSPGGNESTLAMKKGVCSSATAETTCNFTAAYTETKTEGTYYISNVKSSLQDDYGDFGYASFSVVDLKKAGQYVITSDIGGHRLDMVKFDDSNRYGNASGAQSVYGAEYTDGKTRTPVAVGIFGSRQELEDYIDKALDYLKVEKQTIDGNVVYVVDYYGLEIIFWPKKELLVVMTAVKESEEASSQASRSNAVETLGTQELAVQASSSIQPPAGPDIPREILSAYLKKHPSDLGGSASYTLSLRKGWNLFSVPVYEDRAGTPGTPGTPGEPGAGTLFTSYETDCKYKSPVWKYSSASQKYEKTPNVTGSRQGFWVRAQNDCTVTVTGDGVRTVEGYFAGGVKLETGWNIIGGLPDEVRTDRLRGCKIARGPYWYNTASGRWETHEFLEPGRGYLIAVANACTLTFEEEKPPELPEIPATGKIIWKNIR